ncbi:Sodium/hydrogen exchanger family-domain-containing protein [Scenedesmus sp. NREL 46B-D3]|nr:Sodium/hydrogen exchanger family-domain-containing protein [Scenedesmus sp. NREL 46B-D3]
MEEVGHVAPTEALLFVLTCILIGIATQYFLSSVPVPYTALLLVFGLCIGLLQGVAHDAHAFTATLSLWMDIDPHLLLLIFLPTIGFSAAIGQEPHLLRKNWGQILILAWPGVVINFLLIALCAKYFFPYGWTWPQALLFGAMLSATDPVAVVAVLHEVGADEKLASVIDGESLVNDGSALVIFLVLQQFVQGASLSAGQIAVLFVRLAVLGAAIGLGFGLVTSLWLARIFNDACLEIVLTFGSAYACYFVAEELAGASGLLAVVVMGFSMSVMGGRHITSRIKVEMHAFWAALEWLANTILFIWVGITLGLLLPPKPSHPSMQMEVDFTDFLIAADVGYAVVLYLWLMVARIITMAVFYPLLSTGRIGYAMNWRTATVMIWAGLRGMVGVAMSLFILFDPLITSDEYKAHCVFFMAIMAFATVVINGSSTKYLLQGLGLLRMTPQQVQVLEHVLQEVDDICSTRLHDQAALHPNPVLGRPDVTAVQAWTHIDARASLASAARKLRRSKALSEHQGGSAAAAAAAAASRAAADEAVGGKGWRQLVSEYRSRLLHVVKAKYGELYQHFELGTGEIGSLQEVTDEALDATAAPHQHHQHMLPQHPQQHPQQQHAATDLDLEKAVASGAAGGLTDWERLKGRLEASSWQDACARVCGAEHLGVPLLQQQAASKLILINAFVEAHTAAQQLIATTSRSSGRQQQQSLTQHALTAPHGALQAPLHLMVLQHMMRQQQQQQQQQQAAADCSSR